MLEDLRKQADESDFDIFTEEQEQNELPRSYSDGRFLGLTPMQRFVIAVMLFAITCLLGSLWLVVTGKVVPPFLY
jgi:hypothetical protein